MRFETNGYVSVLHAIAASYLMGFALFSTRFDHGCNLPPGYPAPKLEKTNGMIFARYLCSICYKILGAFYFLLFRSHCSSSIHSRLLLHSGKKDGRSDLTPEPALSATALRHSQSTTLHHDGTLGRRQDCDPLLPIHGSAHHLHSLSI